MHIGDGIKFIQDRNVSGSSKAVVQDEKRDSDANAQDEYAGIKILIIDADSSDLRQV